MFRGEVLPQMANRKCDVVHNWKSKDHRCILDIEVKSFLKYLAGFSISECDFFWMDALERKRESEVICSNHGADDAL